MPYAKHDGAGVIIERSNTTTLDWLGPWTAIPGISGSPTLPGGTAKTYDATTHDEAAATGFTQKRTGLSDVNDVTFPIFWDPDDTASHQLILADMSARTVRDYRVRMFGVTRKYGVRGQISVGNLTANIDGGLTATVTIAAASVNFNVA